MNVKLANKQDLTDIINIYEREYSMPPKNEVINREWIKEELFKSIQYGFIVILLNNMKEIIGYSSNIPLKNYFNKENFINKRLEYDPIIKETDYIQTGLVIKKEYKGKGLSKLLTSKRFEELKRKKIDNTYTFRRTSDDIINHLLSKKYKNIGTVFLTMNNKTVKRYIWKCNIL